MADIYTISSTTTNTLNPIRDKALYTLVDGAGSSTIVNKLTSALTSSMSSQTARVMNLIPVINDGKMQGMGFSTFKDILYPVESDWVEIGGVKWAKMNVGATGITDYGLYFQWGDTTGYLSSQCGSTGTTNAKPFAWADYKFSGGRTSPGATGMTKYNASDGKTTLDLCDDAARLNWGDGWRMPTTEEFQALGDAVNTAWTADYQGSGVAGMICTDKTDSSKVLFFPAAGRCYNGSVKNVGSSGYYWSSSFDSAGYAHNLRFYSGGVIPQDLNSRFYGYPVRGVVG